ncbi:MULTISPECIES: ead/Ea22-like family protein [Serratia]|uniref:ead/Ea22-like family protein n=1 Tax=Serratia TaxID=613 RepID=UPI001F5B7E87|nr:ead/Ea22-like family protein [Serratia marcescens]
MDKFSELKRRADKCPIKRFKAFIGKANTQATLCADTGIEIIGWSGFDASDLNAKSHRVELARFIAAADPETILALLAELEAKDERIGELEAIATDYAGKFQKAQDALKYAAIMSDEDKKKIAELEKWLATPVRLPDSDIDSALIMAHWCSGEEVNAWVKGIEFAKQQIRAAGFTVEGDE